MYREQRKLGINEVLREFVLLTWDGQVTDPRISEPRRNGKAPHNRMRLRGMAKPALLVRVWMLMVGAENA